MTWLINVDGDQRSVATGSWQKDEYWCKEWTGFTSSISLKSLGFNAETTNTDGVGFTYFEVYKNSVLKHRSTSTDEMNTSDEGQYMWIDSPGPFYSISLLV